MPATRDKIALTARRLYEREGIESVSMRRIAERIGVSATAIYRHYRDKDELLDEITENGFRLFCGYLDHALKGRTPLSRLKRLAEAYLDFALEHPGEYGFLFVLDRRNTRRSPEDFSSRSDLTLHILMQEVESR